MAHLTFLRHKVEKLGGRVVDESSGHWKTYQIEAPAGKCWAASSTHVLCVTWRKERTATREEIARSEAIIDAIHRVTLGVTDCDDPECDYCHPEETKRVAEQSLSGL